MSSSVTRREPVRTASVPLPANAVRLVMLGLTDAGKTTLLGALSRASEVQERILGGRLTDLTSSLRSLRHKTTQSSSELKAYPIRFEPFANGKPDSSLSSDFILIDPDGRRASELIGDQNGNQTKPTPGSLGEQVEKADAVFLVLDASAPDSWIEAGFAEFLMFLRRFRLRRGRETDVAGLPVFLVMTKCDRLARAGDTHAVWTERMEARKEEASQRFEEFLRQSRDPAFGSITFTPTATAAQCPSLTNLQTRPDEPHGVAELFRDAALAAREHHQRRGASGDRLRQLFLILGFIAAFLIGFTSVLMLKRTFWKPTPLVAALENFRADEGSPPAGHLTEPIGTRIERLQALVADSDFKRLYDEDQAFINNRLDELRQFQEFSIRVRSIRPPSAARDLDELASTEKQLRNDLAIPEAYVNAWSATPVGQRRERMIQQVAPLKAAAKQVADAYERRRQQIDRLFVFADRGPNGERLPWPAWTDRVNALLAGMDQPVLNPDDPIADWPTNENERPATMAIPLALLDMDREKQRVKAAADRLANFRDITQVLNLTTSAHPNLRVGTGFAIDQAPALLSAIRSAFPRLGEWKRSDIPDAASTEVQQAARLCYDQLLIPARAAINKLLAETSQAVNPLADVAQHAAGQPALKAWGELAQIAIKLMGSPSDPFSELKKFAESSEFPITIQEVALTLPSDVAGGPFLPNGSWTLFLQDARGITLKRVLRLVEPVEPKKPWRFRTDDAKPLVYRPGDSLWAEVSLRDTTGKDWSLAWVGFGQLSRRYQFDRLSRAPRLFRFDEKPESGKFVLDAKLEFLPPGGVPKLPDLLPDSAKNR